MAEPEQDPEKLTPVMRQYRELKARYPDAVLLFRIGDFYETFETDAELISKELEIVLTSRSKGGENRVPLAGVPYHAVDGYLAKLVGKGYRVAVCDQVEDPKTAKGIVRREITRVITPGTVIDPSMIRSSAASYLMAVCQDAKKRGWGAAFLDISTGEFFVSFTGAGGGLPDLISTIVRYRPAECIVPASSEGELSARIARTGVVVTPFRDEAFAAEAASRGLTSHFGVASLAGFGCGEGEAATCAAGAALAYAKETQFSDLGHIGSLSVRSSSESMMLDAITLRNLEVSESIRGGTKSATLLSSLDQTKTPMGSRLLVRQLSNPSTDIGEINRRLDAVEFLADRTVLRLALRSRIAKCGDLERIAARIAYGNAGPRDLVALADSLSILPDLKSTASETGGEVVPERIRAAITEIREFPDVIDLVHRAIIDDPPAIARNGGMIRTGYSRELDTIRGVLHSGKGWIAALQEQEREATGIKSLKIGYNRVFGYYIDVTKPNLHLVPSHYERKQTTATGERYTLPSLREKESVITSADERVLGMERELFTGLIDSLRKTIPDLQATARGIAVLDVTTTLAEVARNRDYSRPKLTDGNAILIRNGRHPVVEQGMAGGFVPNDTELAGTGTQVMIITGANMAGKSTYMRAVALICIMAQAGCYVPAQSAAIGILDRIFTRVGAFDDLASGQSTFFVEMLELANILNNVTDRSLVILDEIGRGTSTVDGCSIAQAVLEYLHGKGAGGPKTLFATHFHELIETESYLKRVKNYHFAVKETGTEVAFLRRLIPGATDKSYGIHVARLAGIPKKVTDRADVILKETLNRPVGPGTRPRRYTQILLVDDTEPVRSGKSHPVVGILSGLNPDRMTPLQALEQLAELKKMLETEKEP